MTVMAVYLTGDTHGMVGSEDFDRFEVWNFPEGAELTRDDCLIVLGDFGMPSDLFDSDHDLRSLAAKPWTTLFIDGNHERFDYLNHLKVEKWHGGAVHRYPRYENIVHLMRGEVYDIGGYSFFCMGGAQSIDKAIQQSWGTWFPEEIPDEAEYANARKNLARCDWRIDFVLSHTCATRYLAEAIGDKGFIGVGAVSDKLTDFLDELEDKLQYRHWFCGHFHRDCDINSRHTVLYRSIVDLEDYL